MLVDWITARLEYDHFQPDVWQEVIKLSDRIIRFNQENSVSDDVYLLIDHEQIEWNSGAWDSIRSDSHQISFRVGSDAIWIQGSPARVIGSGDAVFSEGSSKALALSSCLKRMISFVSSMINIPLNSDVRLWKVSRVDVTGNLLLDSASDVRIALSALRDCEGGRYRVSQQAGDTVYWSHKSKLRSGKAYAKGPHISYQIKKKGYTGYQYNSQQLITINKILRLELTLGSQYFRELEQRKGIKNWYQLNRNYLIKEWKDYFYRMLGDEEMTNENQIKQRIYSIAKTDGQAKSAYQMYLLLKNEGWQSTREMTSKTTWYRNLKILKNAGFGDADIAKGNVIPFRRKILSFNLVDSFDENQKSLSL